jgi:hypothetical protein
MTRTPKGKKRVPDKAKRALTRIPEDVRHGIATAYQLAQHDLANHERTSNGSWKKQERDQWVRDRIAELATTVDPSKPGYMKACPTARLWSAELVGNTPLFKSAKYWYDQHLSRHHFKDAHKGNSGRRFKSVLTEDEKVACVKRIVAAQGSISTLDSWAKDDQLRSVMGKHKLDARQLLYQLRTVAPTLSRCHTSELKKRLTTEQRLARVRWLYTVGVSLFLPRSQVQLDRLTGPLMVPVVEQLITGGMRQYTTMCNQQLLRCHQVVYADQKAFYLDVKGKVRGWGVASKKERLEYGGTDLNDIVIDMPFSLVSSGFHEHCCHRHCLLQEPAGLT